jgi:hypothetical protein
MVHAQATVFEIEKVCVRVCVCVCVCVCLCVRARVCACVRACVRMYMYICMNLCMHNRRSTICCQTVRQLTVVRRANHGVGELIRVVQNASYSQIPDFDVIILGQENIHGFYVAM